MGMVDHGEAMVGGNINWRPPINGRRL